MPHRLELILLILTCACSPGSRVIDGQSPSTGSAATAAPEPRTRSSIDTRSLDSEDSAEESTIALEPVSIGGAFLSCSYKNAQPQGSPSYMLDCEVGPLPEVTSVISQADFYKLDGNGNRTALSKQSEDLSLLKWTLLEPAANVPFPSVEVVLKASQSLPLTLTTTISSPLVVTPVLTFWFNGEPNNNSSVSAEGEDCVEFLNAAAKNDLQARTGLVTGPLGRFNDFVCGFRSYNFLCRNLKADGQNPWVLSTVKGVFTAAAGACPTGYGFSTPLTEKEIIEVSALVDSVSTPMMIWLNMHDRAEEGRFVVGR